MQLKKSIPWVGVKAVRQINELFLGRPNKGV